MTTLSMILRVGPLLAIILIDSIGYTIVVPVLAAALIGDQPLMMAAAPAGLRYLVYGVALGLYELVMLYAAPVLGEISDRIGRKRILILCMLGMALSFALIGGAIAYNLVALLLIGRFIGGATAGSQAVAQAAAVDASSSQTRALTLSLCLFASSLGFIVGPLIGGAFSHDAAAVLSDFILPMALTAGGALIGLVLIATTFQEAREPPAQADPTPINLLMGVAGFRAALRDPAIRHLMLVFGLMQTAWGTYFLFLPSLVLNRFGEDAGTISLLMATLGIGFCIAYGLCLPVLEKRFDPRAIATWSLWSTAGLIAASLAVPRLDLLWIIAFPTAITVSVAYGAIITLFSRAVSDDRQGWVLGIAIAINALVWGLSSILNGALSAISYLAPFGLCLATLAASAFLMSSPKASPAAARQI